MVGGFVEQEEIGLREEESSEQNAHLPSARELRRAFMQFILSESERSHDRLSFGAEGIAARRFEFVLSSAERRDIFIARVAFDRSLQSFDFVFEIENALPSREDEIDRRFRVEQGDFLRKIADRHRLWNDDRPRIGV